MVRKLIFFYKFCIDRNANGLMSQQNQQWIFNCYLNLNLLFTYLFKDLIVNTAASVFSFIFNMLGVFLIDCIIIIIIQFVSLSNFVHNPQYLSDFSIQ